MASLEKAKILKNQNIKARYFELTISCPKIAAHALPGQFVNVKVSDAGGVFLRRPLSIHRVKEGHIALLYEVMGKGTEILSQRKAGDYLDLIGPLGNGFRNPSPAKRHPLILVAGGMGVAPLFFLAERLKKSQILVLLGARTRSQILCSQEFKKLGCKIRITTDDGSVGSKGKVTDLLKKVLRAHHDSKAPVIYACGPRQMLRQIARIAGVRNIPAQISLEEHMACGIGACLGCVANTIDGYKRVCHDGPVFEAQEIIW